MTARLTAYRSSVRYVITATMPDDTRRVTVITVPYSTLFRMHSAARTIAQRIYPTATNWDATEETHSDKEQ